MKKFILAAFVAVASLTANAQVYLGGNVGFNSVKYGEEKGSNVFTLAPEVGYNISSKYAVGAALNLSIGNRAAGDFTDFELMPYFRYTFASAGPVKFFADGCLSLGTSKLEHHDAQFCWGIGINPGLSVNLAKQVSFVAHLGGIGYKQYGKGGDKVRTFGIGALCSEVSFGVFFNL